MTEDRRESAPGARQGGLKVLIADHDSEAAAVLAALAGHGGNDVTAVRGGDEALAQARQTKPDLLIADWWLPAKGGLDLVRHLRGDRAVPQPYIIVMYDGLEDEGLDAAVQAGADDSLAKPLRQQAALARLRSAQRILALEQACRRHRAELDWYADELNRSQERFQQAVLTDHLTGLPNRHSAEELLQREWAEADIRKAALACLVIDVDNFRQFNDCFGRERGDALLRQVAAALMENLRERDTVCRLGGDRFLVVCPGCRLEDALARGQALLESLGGLLGGPAGHIPLGLSIGAAERGRDTENPRELVRLADRGMHRAKFNGRNRVVSGHGRVGEFQGLYRP